MVNTDEMKMWEEKNKQYSENIEQTKQMQEEIRTQLRALIEHKIKKELGFCRVKLCIIYGLN